MSAQPNLGVLCKRLLAVLSLAVAATLAASAPDLEHVIRLPRPGGRKLFPSHRIPGWHQAGGVPAWAQLLVAGAIVGYLLGSRR